MILQFILGDVEALNIKIAHKNTEKKLKLFTFLKSLKIIKKLVQNLAAKLTADIFILVIKYPLITISTLLAQLLNT